MELEALIGGTPLCRLEENLYLKLEFYNLTGSVKDRAALEMVGDGEKRGILKPGVTVIEPTSGNMGISLAAICAAKGYGCTLVMPDSMSAERRQLMEAFGAKILLTPGRLGMAGAVEQAAREAGWMPNQFENPANPRAHYRTTGPEIWTQTGGEVDIFVAGVGTGGTLTGTARFLKERKPDIQVVAVEPAASPLLGGGRAGSHGIAGIGANFIPKILDISLIDRIIPVTDGQAFAAARALARQGILAGVSAGAAYVAAQSLAAENPDKKVVAILPDSGGRYLSAGLFYDAPAGKV